MAQVVHLNELQEKYYDQGLRIIAITKEPTGTIESALLEAREAKYWVGSDPGGESMKQFTSPGSVGIPHAYLVDASGKVVSEGVPSEQQIEKLLEGAFDAALGKDLHRSLGGAVKSYGKGQIGAAWAASGRFVEDEKRGLAADAAFLREKAQSYAKFVRGLAESGIESKDFGTAMDDLGWLQKDFAGMEAAAWAKTKLAELKADPAVKNELSGMKALRKAQARELDAGGKEKKLKGVVSAYRKVVKKFAGTRAAVEAEAAVKRLDR